ncbi:tigger transposable element-derived protein 7-like [Portunus trituberculatus]|uniref:tigger transposable element-derived protein 7-like n=1 Tax=Portunus trituberculatus TaxID=210409 RepID=UPI001E1CB593|nr:tigger transposable element-derived protein 7-like [Portunus trituberculatus]
MPPKNPPKKVTKRTAKPVHLSVSQKLELLRKIDGGMSVAQVCELYGVKKQTVSDIKKARGKLENYAVKFAVSGKGDATRKHMKDPKCVELDLAVYKWYTQERACGVEVRGVELAASAAKLAAHMGIEFKASDGWLWRFRRRHGIRNLAVTGEAESADAEMIEPFRDELMKLINDEDLSMSQIYNVDETGMMWRALPRNTQAGMHEKKVKGKKVSKERLSVLCGGNASGTHRLKLTVVGKAAKPRALKDIMDKLPVHYYNSSKAWFNSHIFTDYFQHHLVPEVKNYQEKVLKIRPDDVKALILLDNAPPTLPQMC